MFRAWGLLAVAVLVGCAHAPRPDAVQPSEPDRPSLPSDVNPAAWSASLRPLLPQLGSCREFQREPAGRVEVQITVGSNGTPGSIIAYGGAAGLQMRECIAASFAGAQFPRSARGEYTYRYPIVFH